VKEKCRNRRKRMSDSLLFERKKEKAVDPSPVSTS
jgi:hypothetical protein